MSQENVDALRAVYAAFNSHDVDALVAGLRPDCEWIPNPDDPEQNVRRGSAAVIAGLKEAWDALEGLHSEIEELTEFGERILVSVRHTATPEGSDAQIERREVHLWTLEDGKATRVMEFPDRAAALEAVGLRE